jgi:hypothetical protein
MKKTMIMIAIVMGLMTSSAMAVSKENQLKLSSVITEVGMKNMWSQDISLWIEANATPKYELEAIGNKICSLTRGHNLGFYVITFWHSFGHGKITSVKCSS